MSKFIYKLKSLWYYYWGTEEGKYVADHNGNYIVFFDRAMKYETKNTTEWTYKKL